MTLSYAFYSFGAILLVCEIGQIVSDAFEDNWHLHDQFKWHSFPTEILHVLPLVMMISQQPVDIQFFGNHSCKRCFSRKISTEYVFLVLISVSKRYYEIINMKLNKELDFEERILVFHGAS